MIQIEPNLQQLLPEIYEAIGRILPPEKKKKEIKIVKPKSKLPGKKRK